MARGLTTVSGAALPALRRSAATRWVLLILALAVMTPALAEDVPSYQAEYELRHGDTLAGIFRESYRVRPEGYRLESTLGAVGLAALFSKGDIHQISEGTLRDGSPQPGYYRFVQGMEKDYLFTFAGDHISLRGHPDRKRLPRSGPILDEPTLMIEMRGRLLRGETSGETSVLYGAKARVYDYRFAVSGREKVMTPQGEWDTLLVERTSSRGKYRYRFWCAEELAYLPVRIERTDRDGRTAVLLLSAYQAPPSDDPE